MRKLIFVSTILIILLFLVNIYFYTILPDTIITHWNALGQPNGSMPKFIGLFLLPIITLIIFILFLFIPKIDPLKKNYDEFKKYYDSFVLVIILYMFYIDVITLLMNNGVNININNFIIPALGLLLIYLGFILKNVKQNWFIGIRTPWTLSSEKVWTKTHKLGSKLFMISGILTFFGILFPNHMIWFFIIPILISSVFLIIYSYLEYRKEKKK